MEVASGAMAVKWRNWDGSRGTNAADRCWMVEDNLVVLLDADYIDGTAALGPLMSLGLDIWAKFRGRRGEGGDDRLGLIMFHSVNHDCEILQERLREARRMSPESPVCIITGLRQPHNPQTANWLESSSRLSSYDDARAFLEVAGIGFVSIASGTQHANLQKAPVSISG